MSHAASPGMLRRLARKRLQARIDLYLKSGRMPPVPDEGWLATIRKALGMPLECLARKLDVHASSALRLERSEAKGTIQLQALRRAADALGCDVVYVVVPRLPFEGLMREERLRTIKATDALARFAVRLGVDPSSEGDPDAWRELGESLAVHDRDLWR